MFRSEKNDETLDPNKIRMLLTDMFLCPEEEAANRVGPLQELCDRLPLDLYHNICAEALSLAENIRLNIDGEPGSERIF